MSVATETISCYVCGQVHALNAQCCADLLHAPRPALRPLGSRVLVRPDPRPAPSTVIETVSYVDPPETSGQVVALGKRFVCDQCHARRPAAVRPGDRVVFSGTAGQYVHVGADLFVMLDEADVLAVVPQEGTHGS